MKTLDQFNEEARAFTAKAKAQGLSNTGINNTIKLKYAEFLAEQQNQITPYQQAQLDLSKQGSWQLVDTNNDGIVDTQFNPQTGESKPYTGAGMGNEFSALDTGDGSVQSATSDLSAIDIAGDGTVTPQNIQDLGSQPMQQSDNLQIGESLPLQGAAKPSGDYSALLSQLPENQPNTNYIPPQPTSFGSGSYIEQPVGFTTGLYSAVPQPSAIQKIKK